MKKWIMGLALLAVVVYEGMPFSPIDIASLQPVELIRLSRQETWMIQTDTGDQGWGETVEEAFLDLKDHCPGKVFLDTADYLIVTAEALPMPEEIYVYLRPSCAVCLERGEALVAEAAAFLAVHKPEVTLGDYRAGGVQLPVLITREGGMELGSQ